MDKIIHCIWLGGPKTELARQCRASWERFAPEFKIYEWGMEKLVEGWRLKVVREGLTSLLDTLALPKYVQDALEARKWAFAADWLRFVVLERLGGVYFDYDLELLKPIDDLWDGEWCAGEWVKQGASVQFAPGAGIALEKGSAVARQMLAYYETLAYGDGRTVGDIMTALATPLKLLPPEVFCPSDWQGRVTPTAATCGIHHYALSWISPQRRLAKWLNWHGLGWLTELLLRAKRGMKRIHP